MAKKTSTGSLISEDISTKVLQAVWCKGTASCPTKIHLSLARDLWKRSVAPRFCHSNQIRKHLVSMTRCKVVSTKLVWDISNQALYLETQALWPREEGKRWRPYCLQETILVKPTDSLLTYRTWDLACPHSIHLLSPNRRVVVNLHQGMLSRRHSGRTVHSKCLNITMIKVRRKCNSRTTSNLTSSLVLSPWWGNHLKLLPNKTFWKFLLRPTISNWGRKINAKLKDNQIRRSWNEEDVREKEMMSTSLRETRRLMTWEKPWNRKGRKWR